MQTHVSKTALWTGRILSGMAALALVWGGLLLRDQRLRQFLPVLTPGAGSRYGS